MNTLFVTRTVDDFDPCIAWYTTFFGRDFDEAPLANCREWHVRPGVIFQVIHQPEKAGKTSFAFAAADLDRERTRLAAAQLPEAEAWQVTGFEDLTYVAYEDPEGVRTGLLNAPGVGRAS